MRTEQLTHEIIGSAIEVHRLLGPGLLESAYEECLAHELTVRGLNVRRQVPVPVVYKGIRLSVDIEWILLLRILLSSN